MAMGHRARFRWFPAASVPLVLLITFGLASSLNAADPLLSAFQLFELAKGLVLILFVANTVRDERDLNWVLAGLMASVFFQSSLAIYQGIAGRPLGLELIGEPDFVAGQFIGAELSRRPSGTFWHTNQLALFLGMTLPLVVGVLMAHVHRGMKLGAALVLSVGLVAAGLTLSRGTWLGLLVSAMVLVAFALRRRNVFAPRILMGAAWLLIILLALNRATDDVIMLRLTIKDLAAANARIMMVRGAEAIVNDYPFFGSGLNNYEDTIKAYDLSGLFTEEGYSPVVHNIFFLLAAEIGLLGALGFVWLLAVLMWRAFRFSFGARDRPLMLAAVVAGLLASVMHLIIHNMVHVGLAGDTQLYIQLWFLAGLLLALTGGPAPGTTQARNGARA